MCDVFVCDFMYLLMYSKKIKECSFLELEIRFDKKRKYE
jgi:hypothetical protein